MVSTAWNYHCYKCLGKGLLYSTYMPGVQQTIAVGRGASINAETGS